MRVALRKVVKKRPARKSKMTHEEFLQFVLNGPVMTKKQYQEFKDYREHFNRWRAK